MIRISLIAVAVITLVCSAFAQNATYTPVWQAGDHWEVEYQVLRGADVPGGPVSSFEPVRYRYTVLPKVVQSGITTIPIFVTPLAPGSSGWTLSFDPATGALLYVTEQTVGGEKILARNPFGVDSWMTSVDQFSDIVIDYPRLAKVTGSPAHIIRASGISTPNFQQTQLIGAVGLVSVMTRQDPVSGLRQSVKVEWRPHRKWWASVVVTIGNAVQISGRLL